MSSSIGSTGSEQYGVSVATGNITCSLSSAASLARVFKMRMKGLSYSWFGKGKTSNKEDLRTSSKLSSLKQHPSKQVMGLLFNPSRSALYECESILLFGSAGKGVKTLIRLRCQASTKGSTFLEEPLCTGTLDQLETEGANHLVKEPSQRQRSASAKRSLLKKGRRIANNASVLLSGPAAARGNGAVRTRLKALGLLHPAISKSIEANPNLTVGNVLDLSISLTTILGINKKDALLILAKCLSLLKVDSQKLKDVVAFLSELGMDQNDLSNVLTTYPALFLCDVNEIRRIVEYMISVGFPKEELPEILMIRPQVFSYKIEQIRSTFECFIEAGVPSRELVRITKKVPELFSSKNLKARIKFFMHIGLDGTALGKGVARRPNLLSFDLERMKRTNQYLQQFMTPVDMAKLVRRFAEVLVIDPDRKMEPIVNHLLQLGVQRNYIGKVLLRRPQLLGYTVAGLKPSVNYLKELGVKDYLIGRIISISPQILTLHCEEKLKPAVEHLRSIGLSHQEDLEKLLGRNAQILCCSIEKNLKPKLDFFCQMGLSTEDVVKIMVLFPSMFGQSISRSLVPKYEYLINVMKRSPREIVDFPQYFGYSLERRIKPRFEKLAARGIEISLASMLACVEKDFHRRYLVGDPPARAPYMVREQARRSKHNRKPNE